MEIFLALSQVAACQLQHVWSLFMVAYFSSVFTFDVILSWFCLGNNKQFTLSFEWGKNNDQLYVNKMET